VCYDDTQCQSGYCVVKNKNNKSGICYEKDEAFSTVSTVELNGDNESAGDKYYPGESEKVAEKELDDLPETIKHIEEKDHCGEPGEAACAKKTVQAEGYGIDSDDDNTFMEDRVSKKDEDKATSFHQAQVSSGKTDRTDAEMYDTGDYGDKCGTSPVYGKGKYPGCPQGQYCNYEGGTFGLCTSCVGKGESTYAPAMEEVCEGQQNGNAKADCKDKCYTTPPTPSVQYVPDTQDTIYHTYDENLGEEPTPFPTYTKVVHVYTPPPPPPPAPVVHVVVHHVYHTTYSPAYSHLYSTTVVHHFHYASRPPMHYASTPYPITHTTVPYPVSHHMVPYVSPVMHTVIHHYLPPPPPPQSITIHHYVQRYTTPIIIHHYQHTAPIVIHHYGTAQPYQQQQPHYEAASASASASLPGAHGVSSIFNADGAMTKSTASTNTNTNAKQQQQHHNDFSNINRDNSSGDNNGLNSSSAAVMGAVCGVMAMAVAVGYMAASVRKTARRTGVQVGEGVAMTVTMTSAEPMAAYV